MSRNTTNNPHTPSTTSAPTVVPPAPDWDDDLFSALMPTQQPTRQPMQQPMQEPTRQSTPAPAWFVIAIAAALLTAILLVSIDMETRFGKGQEGVLAAITTLQGNVISLQGTVEKQDKTITTLQRDVTSLQGTVEKQGLTIDALEADKEKQGAVISRQAKAISGQAKAISRQAEAIELLQQRAARLEEHDRAQKSSSEINSKRLKALESFARRKACENRPKSSPCMASPRHPKKATVLEVVSVDTGSQVKLVVDENR